MWSARQRAVLIVLVIAIGGWLIVLRIRHPITLNDPPPTQPVHADNLDVLVDPNTADLARLSTLPGLSQAQARAIVSYREKWVVDHPGEQAFESADDLVHVVESGEDRGVVGIGPGTVAKIREYLIFNESPSQR
jgi:DNA uptake protein ComE-like DNA-binding protein